jgi:hypothetical protein
MIIRFLRLFRTFRQLEAAHAMLQRQEQVTRKGMYAAMDLAYDRHQALRQIIKCETPKSNATVRRMAKIARDALQLTQEPTEAIGEPLDVPK